MITFGNNSVSINKDSFAGCGDRFTIPFFHGFPSHTKEELQVLIEELAEYTAFMIRGGIIYNGSDVEKYPRLLNGCSPHVDRISEHFPNVYYEFCLEKGLVPSDETTKFQFITNEVNDLDNMKLNLGPNIGTMLRMYPWFSDRIHPAKANIHDDDIPSDIKNLKNKVGTDKEVYYSAIDQLNNACIALKRDQPVLPIILFHPETEPDEDLTPEINISLSNSSRKQRYLSVILYKSIFGLHVEVSAISTRGPDGIYDVFVDTVFWSMLGKAIAKYIKRDLFNVSIRYSDSEVFTATDSCGWLTKMYSAFKQNKQHESRIVFDVDLPNGDLFAIEPSSFKFEIQHYQEQNNVQETHHCGQDAREEVQGNGIVWDKSGKIPEKFFPKNDWEIPPSTEIPEGFQRFEVIEPGKIKVNLLPGESLEAGKISVFGGGGSKEDFRGKESCGRSEICCSEQQEACGKNSCK